METIEKTVMELSQELASKFPKAISQIVNLESKYFSEFKAVGYSIYTVLYYDKSKSIENCIVICGFYQDTLNDAVTSFKKEVEIKILERGEKC